MGDPTSVARIRGRIALLELVAAIRNPTAFPTARYLDFQYQFECQGWVPTYLSTSDGTVLAGPGRVREVTPVTTYREAAMAIDPLVSHPQYQDFTIDLDLVLTLGPTDPDYYAADRYALANPTLPTNRILEWLASPILFTANLAWRHPNLPDHIRVIKVLAR